MIKKIINDSDLSNIEIEKIKDIVDNFYSRHPVYRTKLRLIEDIEELIKELK